MQRGASSAPQGSANRAMSLLRATRIARATRRASSRMCRIPPCPRSLYHLSLAFRSRTGSLPSRARSAPRKYTRLPSRSDVAMTRSRSRSTRYSASSEHPDALLALSSTAMVRKRFSRQSRATVSGSPCARQRARYSSTALRSADSPAASTGSDAPNTQTRDVSGRDWKSTRGILAIYHRELPPLPAGDGAALHAARCAHRCAFARRSHLHCLFEGR